MKIPVLLLTTFTLLAVQGATVRTQQAPPPGPFVADELIVSYEPWATAATQTLARERLGAGLKRTLRNAPEGRLELAALPPGLSVQAAIAALSNMAGVQYAEPNWVYTHNATSNDPGFTSGSLWGMEGDASTPVNQYGSQAAEAWTAGFTGSGNVYVGVIDEGIDFNHADLAGNIWTNPFDPVDGIDNDHNGFIDDVHGWDFFADDNSVFDGAPGSTVDSHGTHVAGTIGATGGNGLGVVGANWDVTIIPLKFLGPSGGTTFDAVAALNYLTDLKTRHGLNIVATNNSWGGGGFSQSLLDAITRAAKADILFVAAAGNSNRDNDLLASYPSNYNTTWGSSTEPAAPYDAVIAVASITSTGAKSSFSSYGRNTVDLGAPGSGILSTTPNNTYSTYSGTSMATPHVTGAVAMYASMEPATAFQIRQVILASAIATPTPSMATTSATGGRLNISYFLTGPAPPPAAPAGLSATAVTSSQINLAWSDQSGDERGFRIERCTGSTCTAFAEIATVAANATTYQNTGLSAGVTFRYRVLAFNDNGSSSPSNIAAATTLPATAPAAPSNLAATAISSSQINLSWVDQSTNETGFRVERCTGAGCTSFAPIATLGANVVGYSNTGLSASTTYRYRVVALNGAGDSAASNVAEATTSAASLIPAAPSGLQATLGPGAGQATLTWVDNSSNETGFRIYSFRCADGTCTTPAQVGEVATNVTTFVVTVPAGGSSYVVRAFNSAGVSRASNGVTVQ